jgi:hypothetical protein
MPYNFLDPSQDLRGRAIKSGNSRSSSTDIDYDHTGQDLAAKNGEELSKLGAAKTQGLMEDPLSVMGTSGRIRDLQRYMAAYHSGQSLPDQEVIPGTRLKGIRTSSSNSSDSQVADDYFDPHMRGQDRTK